MKDSLTFIEIMVLIRELKELIGAIVEKIYQLSRNEVVFYLYKGNKKILKIDVPKVVCLTEYKKENPETPSHFSMFLRKHLNNAVIVDVLQPDNERIIEIKLRKGDKNYILFCELFSKGNIILCDDNKKILIPLFAQSWRDRDIRHGETYVLPPKRVEVNDLDFNKFSRILIDSGKDVVRSLATELSVGGTYAEELCYISNIDKHTLPQDLSQEQLRILFDNFIKLIERAKTGAIEANVIFELNSPIDVQPFLLEIYADKKKRIFNSYNEALDFYFANYGASATTKQYSDAVLKEIIKQEAILKQHENYLKELQEKSALFKEQADFIYQHLGEISDLLKVIRDAKEKGYSWDEIINKLEWKKREGNREAMLVKEIRPTDAIIVLSNDAQIDIRKSAAENGNELYEKSKKLASKIEGVESTISLVKEKIRRLKEKEETIEFVAPKKIERREREWYEKFYWFFTSGGKLVLAGKDATQNEILIKKYLEQNDIVFHADVYGSPFVIMKDGKNSSEEDKREAAIFTLCHSRAWKNKRVESVYWVHPEQVSKKAPSGEYIGRGAFMIYGRKNYIKDVELRFGVGVQLDPLRVVSGPVENVRRRAKYYAVLIPGDKSKDTIAKEVKTYLQDAAREEHKQMINSISIEEIKQHVLDSSNVFGVVE